MVSDESTMSDEWVNKGLEEFNAALCLGNQDAVEFCALWMAYVHLIDDILDSREDGRPTMSSEDILGSYALAAALYNSPFYVQHRQMLFPVVLSITNAYADSVAWERSPLNRRRVIADVLRCIGNDLYFIVAIIVGGWAHCRKVSPLLRERSWILQHTEDDKPN
jgi:hypothetical protein